MKLIDADEFKHKWVDSFDTYHGEDCAKFFKDIIDATPSIDATPVVHAHLVAEGINIRIDKYEVEE